MSYIQSRSSRLFLSIFSILAISALAACGSSDATATPGGGSNPTATTTSSGSTPTASSGSTPTATPGGLGDLWCDSIGLAGGIPGVLLGDYISDSPESDLAVSLTSYFEEVLDEALGGVSASCYYEATLDQITSVWISYEIEGNAPSNIAEAISEGLIAQGVNPDRVGMVTTNGYSSVVVTELDLGDGKQNNGAYLYIVDNDVVLFSGSDGSQADPTATPASSGGATATPSGNGPTPTPISEESPSSDLIAELDELLRPLLSEAVGRELTMSTNFSSTADGTTNLFISYAATPGVSGSVASALEAALEEAGATIDTTGAFGGNVSIAFSSLSFSGQTFEGVLTSTAAQPNLTVAMYTTG